MHDLERLVLDAQSPGSAIAWSSLPIQLMRAGAYEEIFEGRAQEWRFENITRRWR